MHRLTRLLSSVCLPAALVCLGVSAAAAEVPLVEFGSPMVYLANTTNPNIGMDWVNEGFDDAAWLAGEYGVGHEGGLPGAINLLRTSVPVGQRSIFTRARFTVSDLSQIGSLLIAADYDDGYAAWINGVEVYRSPEIPLGGLAWNTTPGSHESSNGQSPNYGVPVDITAAAMSALHPGENVLAVGVWNTSAGSSDLVLVPRLSIGTGVTRGPYLQRATPTSIVVRWRTLDAGDSKVSYGTDPASLIGSAVNGAVTNDHEVTLTGLAPSTRYFYAIGSTAGIIEGPTPAFHFTTPPPAGAAVPVRIWALGDSGSPGPVPRGVRDAYKLVSGATRTSLWVMLGDNAYPNGTDTEYQAAVYDMYPEMLRTVPVWPALGNHDTISSNPTTQTGPYFDMFTLPIGAEAGGMPSGTEAYYSFDYGNIHFVVLDSDVSSRLPGGAMATWLQADLQSTERDWIIAYFHHPPYSKGSFDSDTDTRLKQLRENILPILEGNGTDMVMLGHDHTYARSALIDGHYGLAATLGPSMILDAGNGKVNGDGAYLKPLPGVQPHAGTVYVIAGCSASSGSVPQSHPAYLVSLTNFHGSFAIDVNGPQLDAWFLDINRVVRDSFTIYKGTPAPPAADFTASAVSGPAPLPVSFADTSSGPVSLRGWDFQNDGVEDSSAAAPQFTYAAPGLYSVSLTVAGAGGIDQEIRTGFICALSEDGRGDVDADGHDDEDDNCACAHNASQSDADGDTLGDACDPDDDGDGVPDASDCAPLDPALGPPPADVGDSLQVGSPPGIPITWVVPAGALTSNLYRGSMASGAPFAYNQVCFLPGITGASANDPSEPAPGTLHYYLVTGRNSCGEGMLGLDGQGMELTNNAPCP